VSFLKDLVARDDAVVMITGLHWIYLMRAAVWPVVIIAVAVVLRLYALPHHDQMEAPWWMFDFAGFHFDYRNPPIIFFAILLSAAISIPSLVFFFTTRIVLTKTHIFYKTGWLSVDIKEVDLEEIKGETIHKGIIGHLLGYGDLSLDCRFIGDYTIRTLRSPERFFRAVNQQRARSKSQAVA
jgi:hypothetical protein